MDHFSIVMSLVGSMFLSIIGLYIWTFKVAQSMNEQLADIYRCVNNHHQDARIHTPSEDLAKAAVCVALHTAISKDVTEIKADIKELIRRP